MRHVAGGGLIVVAMGNAENRNVVGRTEIITPVDVKPVVDSLSQFVVTTDSVVVTVRLSTTQRARRIAIDWGDDQYDTIWVRPGLPVDLHTHPQDDPLPEGTYEFRHAYELPQGGLPFMRTFLVHVENADGSDDLRLKTVRLVPRFRVIQYRAYLDLLEPCDLFDSSSELTIKQSVAGETVRVWHWEPNSSFYPVSTVLEGSQFAVELTTETDINAPEYTEDVAVSFHFDESDWGPDQSGRHSSTISRYGLPDRAGEDVDATVHVDKSIGGGCEIHLHYDREATLIRPMPSSGSGWPVFEAARS